MTEVKLEIVKWLYVPYRILAAETLSYWIEKIQDIKGNDIPILVMGDFNDQPLCLWQLRSRVTSPRGPHVETWG
ncbi:hypothetical protein ACFL27_03560 [candidate division CSSED10-310 bacterium]|uniref:Endonuclease/exonuclease/phosphatase domain-containing protein n=1 Tax=candidate division CSSED10-310 bacterium TaxID=2855610 RepID=A0ABV6YSV1_UNCC1